MGLDMFLGRYHKANLEKTTFTAEETTRLYYWDSAYELFSACPKPFEKISTEIKVVNQYYDMEKISNDFANGEPLEIGSYSADDICFINYDKGIKLDLDVDIILKNYILQKEEPAYIVEGESEVAYWRKANQIRQWFVNHIEEFGENDNGEYYTVTKELLERLIMDCQIVLSCREEVVIDDKVKKKMNKVKTLSERGVDGEKDGARETLERMEKKYGLTGVAVRPEDILPTSSGFFFGSTEYDDSYYYQLESTIKQCQRVIDETDWENEVVVYTESW